MLTETHCSLCVSRLERHRGPYGTGLLCPSCDQEHADELRALQGDPLPSNTQDQPMQTFTLRDDEGSSETIQAASVDAAMLAARKWLLAGLSNEEDKTQWFDCDIYDAEGDKVARVTESIDPHAPHCRGGEHDWQAPHSIVGGLVANPGVLGRPGGVVITECCMLCGCARVTDTFASRPDTGEQGFASITYDEDRFVEALEKLDD